MSDDVFVTIVSVSVVLYVMYEIADLIGEYPLTA